MPEILTALRREFIYLWYYFSVQLEQIFGWWVLGMMLGSAISVFGKSRIHAAVGALGQGRGGVGRYWPPVRWASPRRCVCMEPSRSRPLSPQKGCGMTCWPPL